MPLRIALRRLSLRQRIVLPFFLVLILVGLTVTYGTSTDISRSYTKSVEERLQAFQEVAYREIKKQELLLLTYANFLEYMHIAAAPGSGSATIGILQDQLYNALHEANISVAYYSPAAVESIPYPSLHSLLDQARQSHRPRFRLATDFGSVPNLVVATADRLEETTDGVIVLQVPFDRHFLRRLAGGFKVTPHLLSMDGALLVAGSENSSPPSLDPADLAALLSGQPLFRTVAGNRYLYQGIPLGTTDLIISVAGAPMGELGGALQALTLRSVLTFLIALLIGGLLYYRLVRQIARPLEELGRATAAVGNGDREYRLPHFEDSEAGRIFASFNRMLENIRAVQQEELARQKALLVAEAEARHQEHLERKNLQIERLKQELKTQAAAASTLLQLVQATGAAADINLVFDGILEILRKALSCDNLGLLLCHPGSEELEVRRTAGDHPGFFEGIKFRLDSGFSGQAARLQEMIYLSDLQANNVRFDYRGGSWPGGSLVCAPMLLNKRIGGLLLLQKNLPNGFGETDLILAQAAASQAALAMENARLYDLTRNLSNLDETTNLANRRFFQEILKRELAQAQRYGSQFSLLMIDIDRFRGYNEAHGHPVGDAALKRVADILLQNTRGIDLVARFGGDSFVVLFPKTDKSGAFKAAEKLRTCIADHPFSGTAAGQPESRITISIGISVYPADSRDYYELLDRADRALRRAKEAGRNRTEFWKAAGVLPESERPRFDIVT